MVSFQLLLLMKYLKNAKIFQILKYIYFHGVSKMVLVSIEHGYIKEVCFYMLKIRYSNFVYNYKSKNIFQKMIIVCKKNLLQNNIKLLNPFIE